MSFVVISTSLNPTSRSRALALEAYAAIRELGQAVDYVDLREWPVPLCDASDAYADANVSRLRDLIAQSSGILLATPVYNFDAAAAAKNLLELTGSAWTNKVAGFLCAAGGSHSYMGVMGLANSLMLDFRVHIIPRFVYATELEFTGDLTPAPAVSARIRELALTLTVLAPAIEQAAGLVARNP